MLAIYEEQRTHKSRRRKLTVGFAVAGGLVTGLITLDWAAALVFGVLGALMGWAYGTDEIKRQDSLRTLRRE